uniref:Inhibitor I9 domain-containing protein n=1 Tax=Triticum aestivum TaxID=4565 RepID=A0A3B5Y213_WHEAT
MMNLLRRKLQSLRGGQKMLRGEGKTGQEHAERPKQGDTSRTQPHAAASAAQIAMAAEPEQQAPAAQEAAVHIVYVDRPEDADPEEFHIRTLAPVLGSEEKARGAVLYHYKHAASGFSAKLTTEQVEDLKKQPGVLQVVPSQTYQLHGHEGGHASTTRTMGLM